MTTLKKAEKNDDIILRLYNPSDNELDNVVKSSDRKIIKTNLAETISAKFDNRIGKKGIETLKILV